MTETWRALHAHTTAVESLLLSVVGPFMERHQQRLTHEFWERHYAGGPHVRVRLQAAAGDIEVLEAELRSELHAWLEQHPSEPMTDYSPERIAILLRREGIDPEAEDLTYRRDVVVAGEYPERGKKYASLAARELAEEFRRARGPLALELLRDGAARHERVFTLYLVLALFNGFGSYVVGSVSYKSHWEGFFATFSNETVLQRVQADYLRRRERLIEVAKDTVSGWNDNFPSDGLLARWQQLLTRMSTRATALLESGEILVDHPRGLGGVLEARKHFLENVVRRDSEFVATLWADPEFMVAVEHDVWFQRPRALVNMLYDLVAAVGLTPLDKMVLCHHAFRTVEELCGCDLNDRLKRNMRAVIGRHRESRVER